MASYETTTNGMPTQGALMKILKYQPETGRLYWMAREPLTKEDKIFNTRYSGKEAFTSKSADGYFHGRIGGKLYYAHRIICAMVHGDFKGHVDHIDGNRANNILMNLRIVSRKENQRNAKKPSHNTSGHVGVTWSSRYEKWVAQIKVDGRSMFLGHFANIEDARLARVSANERFGFHPNHGRNA